MRLLRALVAVALFAPALFIGITVIGQFENYQEFGMEYFTPFHVFNFVILALVAVAFLMLSISVASDRIAPSRNFFDSYVISTLFATAGAATFAVGVYEAEVNNGESFPFNLSAYHTGDVVASTIVGLLFFVLAAYYLFRDQEVTGHENAFQEERHDANADPGFEIRADSDTIVISGNYPSVEHVNGIVRLMLAHQDSSRAAGRFDLGGGVFGQPFGASYGIPVDVISFHELMDMLRRRREEEDRPSSNSDTPGDKTPSEDIPQH